MEEELKERWTALIRPGSDYGYTDDNRIMSRRVTEVYNDLSEYKPKYLTSNGMGYDVNSQTYRLLKPIKVRRKDGGFDYYMVPEFAVEGVYVDLTKPAVEPISNLAPLSNQLAVVLPLPVSKPIPPKSNTVAKLPALKPVVPKSNPIVKLPVPLNLLPYIANVSSDGVAFFNIPDGYTSQLFEEAVKAVYGQNKGLALKPMIYYEQPQQLILQQKLQLLAALLSLKLYLKQRLLILQRLAILLSLNQKLLIALQPNIKYNTSNNAQTVKVPVKNINKPDLVAEVFAYPYRLVDMYSIHPEAYLKVLEYLNNNFDKTKTNNKPDWHVLSLYGFDKVPIGGEINDSVFHYIGKEGKDDLEIRFYNNNPNVINKNEPVSYNAIYDDIIIDNGKLKIYSYSNDDKIYYKNSNGVLVLHPFIWNTYNKVGDLSSYKDSEFISYLRRQGLTELLIADYINKGKNIFTGIKDYNIDKSFFRPIEKELQTLNNSELQVKSVNNSGLQTKNTNNIVLKAKQSAKKVLSFLGFLNGGQLNYLNYIK